uniref:Uncharacterized protein n=2 Tax=unclassified Caudoviricetes TaxID=2788787 RepID=A0A8S5QGK6_9CAUD|nr:MAG TPA: Protein of unknown function (DUF722) [Siphoviridae sp. ctMkg9]DAE17921.1 MAG TPA: Protein of unknown function (DUF722) [Siphoviridae sp. ctRBF36]
MMQYIKEDVEKMLKDHLKNQAKLTEIQLKKEEYEKRLEYAGTVYEETENEIIENMQLAGQAYDSIHSNTNKVSDKVLNTAMNYHKEERHINKEDRQFLQTKLEELTKLKDELDKKIVRVENMINQLSAEEKFVIKIYYMEKSKWDYVSQQYCMEFQKPKSINQLLNIRNTAIKSMLDVLNIGE